MKNKKQIGAWMVLLAVVVGGYAVCRRPDAGLQLPAAPVPAPPEASPSTATTWSAKSIADERLRHAVEELIRKWDGLQALSVSLKTKLPDAAGMEGKTEGTGTYALKREGPTTLTRFRVFNFLTIEREKGVRYVTGDEVIQLYDGQYLWLQFNQPKSQKTTKTFYEPAKVLHIGGEDLFDSIFANNLVEFGGEEQFGEWQTYVLNAKPKDGDWTAKYWFDKATGVQVQLIETKASGDPQLTLTVEKIDLSPEFAPDRFTYQLPEGFELTDETAGQP